MAYALALELEEFAKKYNFTEDIKYSIYKEGQEYKIKILSDKEKILERYLEEMET